MWKNSRFLHLCQVDKFEIAPHVEKLQISPFTSLSRLEIWNFSTWQIFLHRYIGGIYEVWYDSGPPGLLSHLSWSSDKCKNVIFRTEGWVWERDSGVWIIPKRAKCIKGTHYYQRIVSKHITNTRFLWSYRYQCLRWFWQPAPTVAFIFRCGKHLPLSISYSFRFRI